MLNLDVFTFFEIIIYFPIHNLQIELAHFSILIGTCFYSCNLDYSRLRKIADENGSYLLGDMAHTCGLVAAGVIPSPFDYCDIVSTSTYKTLRACRGGAIFYRKGWFLVTKEKVLFLISCDTNKLTVLLLIRCA